MAKASCFTHTDRFMDVGEEPRKLLQPIEGYQSLPLVTLEEAIEPIATLCPDIQRRTYIAKGNCDLCKDGLTLDESAAIFLYTTEWFPVDQCLYAALNSVLRSKNRNKLIQPWLLYMKLFLTALFKLPHYTETVWRGVRLDLRHEYKVGTTITWWGFSSCAESISVLESESFLGQEGKRTLFSIKCFNGKKIRQHSSFEDEDEILLLPGSQFIVESHLQPSKKDPELIIIQLKQVKPPFSLLEEPSMKIASPAGTPVSETSKKHDQFDVEAENQTEISATSILPKAGTSKVNTSFASKASSSSIDKTTKYDTNTGTLT
ncbi:unnamed protein product [Adineta steineri]|uniref:NAD(P)(+)--arginine ADP-ribosyltransferase n=1 Tax=Adineta steineri TaxID=433720 RepID=A0A814P298_9BILA|nr:unnamed protein product [Adineta steineri]CAF4052311.1 unnamed protein product [Adineta steineri]